MNEGPVLPRFIPIASLAPLNQGLGVNADERDAVNGNASHVYVVSVQKDEIEYEPVLSVIQFQRGPIQENGVNGVSNEALIAIVIDRLQGFNEGPYRCRENSLAITHLEEAMHWLNHRTMDRLSRNVEGTSQQ